ncbi:hypothetical protein evm_013941 [Chilo suppressalis]|nr:hypothetical protein evm_013941 [Chilo suppressalis]
MPNYLKRQEKIVLQAIVTGGMPINVPTAGAQAFPMDGIGRLGHDPPRGPSADCTLTEWEIKLSDFWERENAKKFENMAKARAKSIVFERIRTQ